MLLDPLEVQLVHNYRRRMFLKLEAVDEQVEGLVRQGVVMGSKVGPSEFMDDFQHSVCEWQLRQGVEPRLLARSPLVPGLPADLEEADADDGWRVRILEEGTAREAASVADEALGDFHDCLAPRAGTGSTGARLSFCRSYGAMRRTGSTCGRATTTLLRINIVTLGLYIRCCLLIGARSAF